MMPSVGVAISTTVSRIDQLESTLRGSAAEIRQLDECLIICQGSTERAKETHARITACAEEIGAEGSIRVAMFAEAGLSRSRNRGLDMCRSDILWVLDDDIRIRPNAIATIREAARRSPDVDIWVGRICCAHDEGQWYKPYSAAAAVDRLGALRVSSIELVLSTDFFRRTAIRFDPRFGLGSRFPSSEENFLLLDALSRGAKVRRLHQAIVEHDCLSRPGLSHWSRPEVAFTKGAVAREIGGIAGLAVLLRWTLRLSLRGMRAKDLLPLMDGYVKGRGYVTEPSEQAS